MYRKEDLTNFDVTKRYNLLGKYNEVRIPLGLRDKETGGKRCIRGNGHTLEQAYDAVVEFLLDILNGDAKGFCSEEELEILKNKFIKEGTY